MEDNANKLQSVQRKKKKISWHLHLLLGPCRRQVDLLTGALHLLTVRRIGVGRQEKNDK